MPDILTLEDVQARFPLGARILIPAKVTGHGGPPAREYDPPFHSNGPSLQVAFEHPAVGWDGCQQEVVAETAIVGGLELPEVLIAAARALDRAAVHGSLVGMSDLDRIAGELRQLSESIQEDPPAEQRARPGFTFWRAAQRELRWMSRGHVAHEAVVIQDIARRCVGGISAGPQGSSAEARTVILAALRTWKKGHAEHNARLFDLCIERVEQISVDDPMDGYSDKHRWWPHLGGAA